MTQNVTSELRKLNKIDFNVALWLYAECPGELYAYLEFIAGTDYKRKGINLDGEKIFNELIEVNRSRFQRSLLYA